jgi:hypothetical protein
VRGAEGKGIFAGVVTSLEDRYNSTYHSIEVFAGDCIVHLYGCDIES